MSRNESFIRMLEASAIIQYNVALLLEAKAIEAEKSRNWYLRHVNDRAFTQFEDQIKQANETHEQLVELIDGLTKVENALAKNLGILLGSSDDDSFGSGSGGFGDIGGYDSDS